MKKIETALKEKSHSVLIEMEHKLSDYESITPEMQTYVFEILNKFSQVFFSDINVYSLKGELIASSRPKLFEEGLISTRMNKSAYDVLRNEKKILFIQKERIGDYEYMSAYLPLKNFENNTMAYVNLPYFAKQDELQDEISTFITAFVNVFIIIFLLAFLLTVLVSAILLFLCP